MVSILSKLEQHAARQQRLHTMSNPKKHSFSEITEEDEPAYITEHEGKVVLLRAHTISVVAE